jgi:hypothetical protein
LNALGTIDAQIDAFSVTDQNPLGMRDSLVQQVLSVRDGAVTQLRPFLRMESDEIAAQLRETQAALLSVNEERRALADLLSQARQGKVEEAGQDAYQFFEDEATAHDNTASKFLVYTVGFSLVLFAVALAFIVYVSVNPPSYANWGDAAAATVPKITLLLILSFAVGFAARNYRINRHLSVLNRTKAVTIRAAERYAAGVEEPAHRDLVVASLVQSVFSIGDTGYLPVDSERTIIESPGVASMIAASTPKAGS